MIDDNSQNDSSGQSGMNSETELRNKENETGQQSGFGQQDQAQSGQQSEQPEGGQSQGDSGSGFVGSTGDQSSDYLTEGDNQDFQPEGQGSSDSDAGIADIETGQSQDGEQIDDGSETSL